MRRSEALQGVRTIRFLAVLGRYEAAEFNQLEAAELLGVGERTFRRWRQRFEDEGEAGLLDRRLGKASGKRGPVDRGMEVETLYGRAIRVSPPSTSTSSWFSVTTSPGATPGRRLSFIRRACWSAPGGVGRIVASGRVGR